MKTLRISFVMSDGRSRTFTFRNPKDDLSADEAQQLGQSMIGVVVPPDWQLDRAAVVDTVTNELFDLIE